MKQREAKMEDGVQSIEGERSRILEHERDRKNMLCIWLSFHCIQFDIEPNLA